MWSLIVLQIVHEPFPLLHSRQHSEADLMRLLLRRRQLSQHMAECTRLQCHSMRKQPA